MSHQATTGSARLVELDGLRGWAAVWVVVFHLGWESFGAIIPAFRNPISAAFNGDLAVTVFFVLSGEALSSGFFAGRGLTQVTGLAVRRLPRLSIPIFAAMVLTYLVARLGLTPNIAQAARIVRRPDWLGAFHPEVITPLSMIRFALMDVYMGRHVDGTTIPFLWTMHIEMVGSLLVFIALGFWSRLRYPQTFILAVSCFLLTNFPACDLADFLFGVVISCARHRGTFNRLAEGRLFCFAAPLGILLCLALSAGGQYAGLGQKAAPYLAPSLVIAISLCPPVSRFLANRLSRFLGHISFPLYLVQYSVITSLTSTAIVRFTPNGQLTLGSALSIAGASLAVSLVAAMLFEPVELLTRRVGQALSKRLVWGPDELVAPIRFGL